MRDAVAPSGLVRYSSLLQDVELRELARQSVAQVPHVDAKKLATHDDKLAFWINAYNAFALVNAAAAYDNDDAFRPDQDGFVFFDAPFTVGGVELSLNLIEQGVLRGNLQHPSTGGLSEERWAVVEALHDDLWQDAAFDPRFHFVLNCARRAVRDYPHLPWQEPLSSPTLESHYPMCSTS
ncbi:MAG: DUF547 domain-containing protein [Deltaproteobacteria bacterium]|nr:DUF547 domain-containing protein [Deltaproteobacteria bacterium]